jgi:hypothetical protein
MGAHCHGNHRRRPCDCVQVAISERLSQRAVLSVFAPFSAARWFDWSKASCPGMCASAMDNCSRAPTTECSEILASIAPR